MNSKLKFQLWEYRMKDDEINSSSDDSKLNSGLEPSRDRLRVLSDFIFPKDDDDDDENENTPSPQHSHRLNPLQIVSRKKKVAAVNRSKGNTLKKRKREGNQTGGEPLLTTQLAELKTLSDSLLKELEIARNAMLVQMKKQIMELMTAKPISRTKRKEGKNDGAIQQGSRAQTCNGRLGSSKCHKATEKRANHEDTAVDSGMDKRENNLSLPEEKPTNDSRPKTEFLKTEFSSSDQTPAACSMTRSNIVEKPSLHTDEQKHHGYSQNVLPDEQFGNFSQMSSKSVVGFFDRQSKPSGLRMNAGEMRFPGRSYAL